MRSGIWANGPAYLHALDVLDGAYHRPGLGASPGLRVGHSLGFRAGRALILPMGTRRFWLGRRLLRLNVGLLLPHSAGPALRPRRLLLPAPLLPGHSGQAGPHSGNALRVSVVARTENFVEFACFGIFSKSFVASVRRVQFSWLGILRLK